MAIGDPCACGSGKPKDALFDARGIFCCYYCEDCEETQRAKFRQDVLVNPDYQCDEQIESDY